MAFAPPRRRSVSGSSSGTAYDSSTCPELQKGKKQPRRSSSSSSSSSMTATPSRYLLPRSALPLSCHEIRCCHHSHHFDAADEEVKKLKALASKSPRQTPSKKTMPVLLPASSLTKPVVSSAYASLSAGKDDDGHNKTAAPVSSTEKGKVVTVQYICTHCKSTTKKMKEGTTPLRSDSSEGDEERVARRLFVTNAKSEMPALRPSMEDPTIVRRAPALNPCCSAKGKCNDGTAHISIVDGAPTATEQNDDRKKRSHAAMITNSSFLESSNVSENDDGENDDGNETVPAVLANESSRNQEEGVGPVQRRAPAIKRVAKSKFTDPTLSSEMAIAPTAFIVMKDDAPTCFDATMTASSSFLESSNGNGGASEIDDGNETVPAVVAATIATDNSKKTNTTTFLKFSDLQPTTSKSSKMCVGAPIQNNSTLKFDPPHVPLTSTPLARAMKRTSMSTSSSSLSLSSSGGGAGGGPRVVVNKEKKNNNNHVNNNGCYYLRFCWCCGGEMCKEDDFKTCPLCDEACVADHVHSTRHQAILRQLAELGIEPSSNAHHDFILMNAFAT